MEVGRRAMRPALSGGMAEERVATSVVVRESTPLLRAPG
jgi:hypothetical protein